jgi:ubiquitin conjugation factor E4 B
MREQSNDSDLFLRFVNMLINDSIYLLDECLSKLPEIRTTQLLMADSKEWEKLSPELKKEKMDALARNEHMVKMFMALANESINMLHYLSADLVEPFMRSELVDRLANMLDYFLVQLAGPKCQELKVQNPEKYKFDPRMLLGQLVDIFINFGRSSAFIQAVVNDGRSYSHELFSKAFRIISNHGLRGQDVVGRFEVLINKLHKASEEIKQSEEDLGDVPDDYLDPILSTLMRDPVKLPSSGVTVDRATITRHLLSDQSDPFNRSPLTVDQLQPDLELKAKIDAWIASKKK